MLLLRGGESSSALVSLYIPFLYSRPPQTNTLPRAEHVFQSPPSSLPADLLFSHTWSGSPVHRLSSVPSPPNTVSIHTDTQATSHSADMTVPGLWLYSAAQNKSEPVCCGRGGTKMWAVVVESTEHEPSLPRLADKISDDNEGREGAAEGGFAGVTRHERQRGRHQISI